MTPPMTGPESLVLLPLELWAGVGRGSRQLGPVVGARCKMHAHTHAARASGREREREGEGEGEDTPESNETASNNTSTNKAMTGSASNSPAVVR